MLLAPFSPEAELGRHKVNRNNLPGGSLDAHQVWACHNQAVYISLAQGARSQYCSPHTSLMAICGHYGLPMSHTRAPNAASAPLGLPLWVSPQNYCSHHHCCCAYSGCCYRCLFSYSTPSNTSYQPNSMPAVMQGVVYLPARWVRYTQDMHTPNMDSLMEDPLTLFLLAEYILFILVQSPALTSHLFYSAPSISLCLSALVYQPMSGPSCGLDHCG